jgi:predicted GH43/DUF377 family glycosyl hydrolase
MSPFQVERLGTIMQPDPDNPAEAEGVLNPAAVRGPDGHLYLFPRLVAEGNYSRIGLARVIFDAGGDPRRVELIGIAMEPEADYELRPGGGGCEDPRVTFVEPLGHYVMTYTALGPNGPRIALAASGDLIHWNRLGLATFLPYEGIHFEGVDNKDSCLFPSAIPGPMGGPSLAIIHRPLFPGTRPEEKVEGAHPDHFDLHRESIWISYRDIGLPGGDPRHLCHFTHHHRLASPISPWESVKIGAGAPPVLTELGWLIVYHGVQQIANAADATHPLRYSAGVMVLSKEDPQEIIYRSSEPILTPELPEERIGTIGDVVFPTGLDPRKKEPGRIDLYYGMADNRIGAAKLFVPHTLPRTETIGAAVRDRDAAETERAHSGAKG